MKKTHGKVDLEYVMNASRRVRRAFLSVLRKGGIDFAVNNFSRLYRGKR